MKPSPLRSENVHVVLDALNRLKPDAGPEWGCMTPAAMVSHLSQTLRVTLGEVPVTDRSNWVTRNVIGRLVFGGYLPLPKNVKGPTEMFTDSAGDLSAEIATFEQLLRKFVTAAEAEPNRIGISPLFGPIPFHRWQLAHAIHINHHLRQFGLTESRE